MHNSARQTCTQKRNHKIKAYKIKSYFDTNEEQPDIIKVNERLLHIEQLFVEFDEVQTQIEQSDTTSQEIERDVFETTFYNIISKAKALCLIKNSTGRPSFNDTITF